MHHQKPLLISQTRKSHKRLLQRRQLLQQLTLLQPELRQRRETATPALWQQPPWWNLRLKHGTGQWSMVFHVMLIHGVSMKFIDFC